MKKKATVKNKISKLGLIYWLGGIFLILLIGILSWYQLQGAPELDDGYTLTDVRKISQEGVFLLRFNQAMNQKSVEDAFSISPKINGSFNWIDGKTLQFDSDSNLEIGKLYEVKIRSTAKSFLFKEIGIDLKLAFEVTGAPFVKFISPAPSSLFEEGLNVDEVTFVQGEEITSGSGPLIISPDQKITVMFDRPIRSLTDIDSVSQSDFPQLKINPPVSGEYEWIGTTAFQFIPEKWEMGTTYDLTLEEGIQTLDGAKTNRSMNWQLATERLKVSSHQPFQNDDTFSVKGDIQIQFNQAIDLDQIQPGENVLLYPSNDLDAGKELRKDGFFNTEVTYGKDEEGKLDQTVLLFKPSFDYQYHQDYRLVLKGGLKSLIHKKDPAFGDRFMLEDYELKFRTVKKPAVVTTYPKNNAQDHSGKSIQIQFASPMTEELIKDLISIEPKPEEDAVIDVYRLGTKSGTVWEADIQYNLLPSTSYHFKLKPFKDTLGNESSEGVNLTFKTAARPAYASLLTKDQFGLFTKGLDPVFTVKSVNIKELNVRLCSISEADFISRTQNYKWYDYRCSPEFQKNIKVPSQLNQNQFTDIDLRSIYDLDFESGIYFFEVSSPQFKNYKKEPKRFYQTFFISETNLTLKRSEQDLLVWATDLKTGLPVSRMEIKVISKSGKILQKGTTDGSGVYKISKEFSDEIFVVATKNIEGEKRWSMVSEFWNSGIQTWQFNGLGGSWIDMNEPRVYLYSDRPLYRPSDEIHFKGIYRIDKDARLVLPESSKVKVVLEDSEYNEIEIQEVNVLKDGSFNGNFKLNENARLGRYNLYAETLEDEYSPRFYHNFYVEEFVKPKFKVEVNPKKESFLYSEPLDLNLKANYFFGGAIQGADVNWNLIREPYIFDEYSGDRYYSFSKWLGFYCFWDACDSEIETLESGEGQLDKKGELNLSLPAISEKPDKSYLYTIEVDVRNTDGEVVTKSESFVVHQGDFYVGLSSESYLVKAGDSFEVDLIGVSPKGDLVSGKRVDLELFQKKWNTVKKKGIDGAFYEESVQEEISIKKKSINTSDKAKKVSFSADDLEAGEYLVRAIGAGGSTSELSFYLSSSEFISWGASNHNRIEIVPDRNEYLVGGKAKLLIKSPYGSEESPVKALVTYERSTIRSYEVIDITSNSQTIEVSIGEEMTPNLFVSVMLVKGPGKLLDDYVDFVNLDRSKTKLKDVEGRLSTVKAELKKLQETPEDERENRDRILLSRKQSELSDLESEYSQLSENLEGGEIDDSKFKYEFLKPDFKLGIANLRVNNRNKKISTEIKTSKEFYQVGEPVEIEIYTKDYQNKPVSGVVSLAVVDKSLLALKANRKENPLNYFFQNRSLRVSTASTLTLHVDRVNVKSQQGAKGGDGESDATDINKERGEFKDTAYFNPSIQTDAGGYAKITFDPPDNLTTWEVWAVATSNQDRFGMAKKDFIVRRPVSITGILPSFMTSGDEIRMGALAHNQTDESVSLSLNLKADDLNFKEAKTQNKSIPPGESIPFYWTVKAPQVLRKKPIEVRLESNQDTLVKTINVLPHSFPEIVATNGTVEEQMTEKLILPKNAEVELSELSVKTSGSSLTSFIDDFNGLVDYPYGCAEQVTSKILPNLILFNQAAQQEIDLFGLFELDAEKQRVFVQSTLQNLINFQRFDGGYGFWEGSTYSSPLLTAYVLYAQKLAKESGFTISQNSYNQGVQYLWNALNDPKNSITLNNRAFVLWALSELGQNDTGMTLALFEDREEMSLYAKAFMLMNINNLFKNGQVSVKSFAERLKAEIVAKQIIDDRLVQFQEEYNDYYHLNTNRRTTALILMALNRDDSTNPILSNIVNYLTHSKSRGHLLNTQETAWILSAMLEYSADRNILNPDLTFDLEVNGSTVQDGKLTTDNLFEIFEKRLLAKELNAPGQVNEVNWNKAGEGELNYDLKLKYFLPNESLVPQEKGFLITREYTHLETGDLTDQSFTSGEIYKGKLTVIVPADRHQVVVEERLPAGFEPINFNLDNTRKSLENSINQNDGYWYDNPLWHFNHRETRLDRVLLFADFLPRGVYEYEFLVRAGLPGSYQHLPASAHQMYFPEVFGRTEGKGVRVVE